MPGRGGPQMSEFRVRMQRRQGRGRKRSVSAPQSQHQRNVFMLKHPYQIGERVKLLPHQRRLLAPASNPSIHEVEEQTKRHERKSSPHITVLSGVSEAIAHRREDGHDCSVWLAADRQIRGRLNLPPQKPDHVKISHLVSRMPRGKGNSHH